MKLVLISIALVSVLALAGYHILSSPQPLSKLPSFNVDTTQTSTSGISSGGFMAVQVGYAFSQNIIGVGVVAGGPYICAQGSMATATTSCMSMPMGINLEILNQKARSLESSSQIDSLSNIKNQKIYIYSGTQDTVVKKGVVEKAQQQYADFGAQNIVTEYSIASAHAWITNNYGNSCGNFGSPYINNCGYNQAEKILTAIYGQLNPGVEMVSANLMQFDQTGYKVGSMDKVGYIYVPTKCKFGSTCKIHVAFHGCNMGQSKIGDAFVRHSGLNEIAESNNFIILYPQAMASQLEPSNPQGCWDWWGYDDGVLPIPTFKYVTKQGKQMAQIQNMLNDLAGKSDAF